MRRILASKTGMRGALPKGTHVAASRSGSEEVGAEDATHVEEGKATQGLTHMGSIGSPLPVADRRLQLRC